MGRDNLYITVPSFFKCPISLDVMKSPVSLCTGVTYDRASIQRWLDSGNNTCPATMQVLDSKDFVPNHTLQRLIQIWSNPSSSFIRPESVPEPSLTLHSLLSHHVLDLINQLTSQQTPPATSQYFEPFLKILCFASENPDNLKLISSKDPFLNLLIRVVCYDPDPDLLEAVLKLLHLITASYENKPKLKSMILKNPDWDFLGSMSRILKTGRSDSWVVVSKILEAIAPDPDSKKTIFESEDLVTELLRALKLSSTTAISKPQLSESILSCLISLCIPRMNKIKLVRAGGVRVLIDTLNNRNDVDGSRAAELVLTLLEMVAGCAEGRAAIGEDPNGVAGIVQKLMKVSRSANEHGVALLWSLCYLFRDRKAREGLMRSHAGLTKILLLMQSDCSPAVKRMCCDLLRIFRVNSKSCLSSYDTKTTHIMPC